MTQGRKYSGNPRQSVEERKRHSTCAACGGIGHWAGDNQRRAAPPSGPPSGSNLRNDHNKGAGKRDKGKGKSSSFRPRFNKEDDKKVFTVKHASGFDPSEETTDGKSHFVMVVHM